MMRAVGGTLVASAWMLSGPSFAQSAVDEACTGLYSVQKRLCSVEHLYRCEAGGETLLRSDSWDPDEGTVTSIFTEDGDWIALGFNSDYMQFVEVLERNDTFSISALFETGSDTYDYTFTATIPDLFVDPVPIRLFGVTTVANRTRVIDGIEFQVLSDQATMQLNALEFKMATTAYYDRANNMMMYGQSDMTIYGQVETVVGDAERIIKPDEPGFLVDTALYDCGELS